MKITDNKPYHLQVRLTNKQYKYLQDISEKTKLSLSDVLRMIIDKNIIDCQKL